MALLKKSFENGVVIAGTKEEVCEFLEEVIKGTANKKTSEDWIDELSSS